MAKAINNDVCIKGSTLIIGVKFPKVDGLYSFADLLGSGNITVYYYIINTDRKIKAIDLFKVYEDDDDLYAFTIDTSDLLSGVLMVETIATIPAHDSLPKRTEIARCSTGIAIIK